MLEQTNEPQSQKRLTDEELKDSFITIRVNSQLKANLKAKADACGMHLGEYILSLCVGYKPKAAMTAEQEKMLEGLIGARNDIKNFSNALNYRSPADRKRLFGDDNFMKGWMAAVNIERLQLNDIIYSFTNPNS